MLILTTALLVIVTVFFVGYPLFRARARNANNDAKQNPVTDSQPRIRALLEELELDYRMGNISEEDYRELDARYRAELD